MRKFRFNIQLIILFGIILLISSSLFSILVVSRLSDVGESLTFSKLSNYINSTENIWKDGNEVYQFTGDVELGTIQGKVIVNTPNDKDSNPTDILSIQYAPNRISNFDITYLSENIANIITYEDQMMMLNSINFIPNASGSASQKTSKDGQNGNIYYSYKIAANGNFIVAITNESFSSNLRDSIFVQMITIYIIVILFSALILGLWSGAYVSRTNRIKKHIANLQPSGYKEQYYDDGKDELAELSCSIEDMRKQILKNEETKQDMLQNLSHDFKTPIAVIKSYTEAIQDNMGDPKENADVILKQTDILKNKVSKLLQYNKLEYLTKDKEFEDCNLADIIRNVVNTYKFQTKLKIITDCDDTIFKGYQENFYTVIDNMLDNAKRYAKTQIVIRLHNRVLTIYNDGDHIDEQFLNGLFKPYEKGSKGQFGLGMSIVKKTLDFFDMELSVKNEEVGVTFTIKEKTKENVYLL